MKQRNRDRERKCVFEKERRRGRDGGKGERLKAGLPGPEKFKRPNLAISSFRKGQILKNEKKAK